MNATQPTRNIFERLPDEEPLCDITLAVHIGPITASLWGDRNPVFDYAAGPPFTPELRGRRAISLLAAAEIALQHVSAECPTPPVGSIELFNFFGIKDVALAWGVSQICSKRPLCAYVTVESAYQSFALSFVAQITQRAALETGYALNSDGTSKRYNRRTIKNTVDTSDLTDALLEYLKHHLDLSRTHLAVLSDSANSESAASTRHLQRSAQRLGFRLQVETLSRAQPSDPDEVEAAVKRVKEGGYHTILLDCFDTLRDLPKVAGAADRLDLLGSDYFWIFSHHCMPLHFQKAWPENMPETVYKLMDGAVVLQLLDGFHWKNRQLVKKWGSEHVAQPEGDFFMTAWRQQNASLVDSLNAKMRNALDDDDPELFQAPADYFQAEDPFHYSSYVYDSVLSVGRAACRTNSNLTLSRSEATQQILPEILRSPPYDGASGQIAWGSDTTRSTQDVAFGIFNIRRRSGNTPLPGSERFDVVLTSLRRSGTWYDVHGERFLYNGGTPLEPVPIRDAADESYLPKAFNAVGLSLMTASLVLLIAGAATLFRKRREKQRILYLTILGIVMMLSTSAALAYDESYAMSTTELSLLCSTAPWLFVGGFHLIYASLWIRLSEKRMDRNIVLLRHRLRLLSLMIFCFAVTVLVVWTIVDPYFWKREIEQESPLETLGSCTCEHLTLFFTLSWVLLVGAAITFGAAILLTTDHTSQPFRTGGFRRWTLWGVGVHLQVLVVGPLLLSTLEKSAVKAKYAGTVSFLFALSVSAFLYFVGPAAHAVVTSHDGWNETADSSPEQSSLRWSWEGMRHALSLVWTKYSSSMSTVERRQNEVASARSSGLLSAPSTAPSASSAFYDSSVNESISQGDSSTFHGVREGVHNFAEPNGMEGKELRNRDIKSKEKIDLAPSVSSFSTFPVREMATVEEGDENSVEEERRSSARKAEKTRGARSVRSPWRVNDKGLEAGRKNTTASLPEVSSLSAPTVASKSDVTQHDDLVSRSNDVTNHSKPVEEIFEKPERSMYSPSEISMLTDPTSFFEGKAKIAAAKDSEGEEFGLKKGSVPSSWLDCAGLGSFQQLPKDAKNRMVEALSLDSTKTSRNEAEKESPLHTARKAKKKAQADIKASSVSSLSGLSYMSWDERKSMDFEQPPEEAKNRMAEALSMESRRNESERESPVRTTIKSAHKSKKDASEDIKASEVSSLSRPSFMS